MENIHWEKLFFNTFDKLKSSISSRKEMVWYDIHWEKIFHNKFDKIERKINC